MAGLYTFAELNISQNKCKISIGVSASSVLPVEDKWAPSLFGWLMEDYLN